MKIISRQLSYVTLDLNFSAKNVIFVHYYKRNKTIQNTQENELTLAVTIIVVSVISVVSLAVISVTVGWISVSTTAVMRIGLVLL